jgi:regulator of protease activity HflC (stomatin/prohibitin superfamily)
MKKLVLAFSLLAILATSCTNVDPGHKGLRIEYGGKTDMSMVYPEGMHTGFSWLVDDMVEYDVRERTTVQIMEFNDMNNMKTGVEIAVDYNPDPAKLPLLHTTITDFETKVAKTIKSAAKEVIPQYTASELNLSKRTEAEQKLSEILSNEFPEFYMSFARVQLTDVDIPGEIAAAAEATAKQLEVNKLEGEKAIAAEKRFNAAEWDSKTKAILSKPEMLELQRVENERLKWEGFKTHGKSPYGENNTFAVEMGFFKSVK